MKEKMMNLLFVIGIVLVFIIGTWGIIYEYIILNKSIIPEMIFIISCITGYIGIIFIIIWYFWQKKHK